MFNKYLIIDITSGRVIGGVLAKTSQGALRLGNNLFGWRQWNRAYIIE